MWPWLENTINWLLGPETAIGKSPGHLWPRWIFLRALGLIYFSAFYSLIFQIRGLLGPDGILPAGDYLQAVAAAVHGYKWWYAPSLFWVSSSDRALMIVTIAGLIASILVIANIWPRAALLVCLICFLSFVATARDFASYQSDGMLLEAGFIALFFAPPGLRPGLARAHPASRASLFLLQWEAFRIYFESGVAKMASHDPTWRNFTAMDDYYQNAPLPTWIGWYVGHFPHWFHASAVFYTLAIELALSWLIFLPRKFRIAFFFIVLPFQTSIILTGNYAFLNYIVLCLGFLFLDDRFIEWIVPKRIQALIDRKPASAPPELMATSDTRVPWRHILQPVRLTFAGICLALVFYATSAKLIWMFEPSSPIPQWPVEALEPFRFANQYGLFAVMTHARYEIEFQGSMDGKTWTPYPFRYKPQDPGKPPGIYAPYQPRFEWNLWFASLGAWPEYRFVVWTEERLLTASPDVLALFARNPFPGGEPRQVRAVVYQYWFTDMETKRATGMWWRRELLGDYAPSLDRQPDGKIVVLDTPTVEQLPQ
ncbi:MAG TPA: lipase maturation factor family protein [Candidatus Baltobacteraceae bacterium]|nr:lipase maturation factor family protein [Candidatus Baltobacteraceae bacterium]